MPNWCANTLTLTHNDTAKITQAAEAFTRGEFFATLVPRPTAEDDNWYDWNCGNWGTKWDVGGTEYGAPEIFNDGHSVSFNFDSAWSPPIQAYINLEQSGFQIEAMYYESGMCFAGIYDDSGDDYYDLSDMTSTEVKNTLPTVLDECFGISEVMAEYEEPEPLTEWYVEGAKEKGLIKDE